MLNNLTNTNKNIQRWSFTYTAYYGIHIYPKEFSWLKLQHTYNDNVRINRRNSFYNNNKEINNLH